jgi:hypothetical protein
MSAEIISFTQHRTMARRGELEPQRKNMHTLVFRSRAVILEATLLRDVRFDFGKAERKLIKLRRHLKDFRARTAKEIETLTRWRQSSVPRSTLLASSWKEPKGEAPSPIAPEAQQAKAGGTQSAVGPVTTTARGYGPAFRCQAFLPDCEPVHKRLTRARRKNGGHGGYRP